MTRWVWALVLALLPQLSVAAPVKVSSGEHDGFTRLVMEYGTPVDWAVGRTTDGYGLRLTGENPLYDLSTAFKVIGKSRLAAIWADPETGMLRIGIACACHAIPFEFRPGIVVIDLKDGPPPNGSSFELALDGATVEGLSSRPNPRPRARPGQTTGAVYLWTAALPQPEPDFASAATIAVEGADPARVDLTLQPLRDQLLRQMSRGAAQGLVDMLLPRAIASPKNGTPFASAQIQIGAVPGVEAGTGLPEHQPTASDGGSCVSAASLDLAAWGDGSPVFMQIAEAMGGLIGEFDKPDSHALQKAVRFNLFLGFGAEANHLLLAFPLEHPDRAIWKSLAHLIDDEPERISAFARQEGCDTPAALWAILADPALQKGGRQNAKSALLAFSALPVHLRRHLGVRLAERFMAIGENESARAVRDAILRAPGTVGADVDLLQVQMDLNSGDPQAAEMRAIDVLAEAGPNAGEAMIALTEARAMQYLPVEPSLVLALEALVTEHQGTPDAPRYQRALALAEAASGDFAAAFSRSEATADTVDHIWALLARLGTDEALLNFAVIPETTAWPKVGTETAATIATRLLGLGFAEPALSWMVPVQEFDPLLLAKAQLLLRDGQKALRALQGLTTPEALVLQAEAFHLLGEESAAADAYVAAGDTEASWRASIRAQDWRKLAATGPDPWKSAASSVIRASPSIDADTAPGATVPTEEGLLARSLRLVESSTAARLALTTLLAEVPVPQQTSQ